MFRAWLVMALAAAALAGCDGGASAAGDDVTDAGGDDAGAGGDDAGGGGAGGGGAGGGGEPLTDCGADVDLVDFNAVARADGDRLVFEGATGDDDVFEASCSGGLPGGDAVVRFTAPSAGPWLLSTAGTDFDTVIHALADCHDGFSELACNDDVERGTLTSRIVLELEAGAVAYVVVDRYDGLDAAPFTLTAEPLVATAPTLATLEGYYNPEAASVGWVGTGTDPEGDLSRLRIGLVDARGNPLRLSQAGDEAEIALADFPTFSARSLPDGTFTVEGSLAFEQLPAIGGVTLAVGDATGRWSERLQADARRSTTVRERGEPCDPAEARDVCDRTACIDREGDLTYTCEPATPPVLERAVAYLNAEANTVGLHVTGIDREDDLAFVAVTGLNANGLEIPFLRAPGLVPVAFRRLRQGDGTFEGVVSFGAVFERCADAAARDYQDCLRGGRSAERCEAEVLESYEQCNRSRAAALDRLRVVLVDAARLVSEVVDVEILPTPTVEPGAVCDTALAVGLCPEGTGCADLGEAGAPSTCEPLAVACPDAWRAVDLAAHADGDAIVYRGELDRAVSRAGGGTCQGGGPDAAHRFVAAQAGRYAVTATGGKHFTPIVYARSHCAFTGAAFELACDAEPEGEGPRASTSVELDLAAGAEAHLFVDDPTGVGGAYTLTVRRVGD